MTRCRFANKVSLLEIVREHAFDFFFALEQENQIKKEASRMICEYMVRLIFFCDFIQHQICWIFLYNRNTIKKPTRRIKSQKTVFELCCTHACRFDNPLGSRIIIRRFICLPSVCLLDIETYANHAFLRHFISFSLPVHSQRFRKHVQHEFTENLTPNKKTSGCPTQYLMNTCYKH